MPVCRVAVFADVCKQWGHTKKDCPHKRCRFCNKEGHVAEDCPSKDAKIDKQFADDKARKRQKQYAARRHYGRLPTHRFRPPTPPPPPPPALPLWWKLLVPSPPLPNLALVEILPSC